jgi:hypothetical protein
MKKVYLIFFTFILCISIGYSQKGEKEIKKNDTLSAVQKIAGITDRAGGTHDASNIGLFFENRGKLYPRRLTQGPSGEYPINSSHNYIYRLNPFIGIPGNVVQGRYTTNEEWEAVGGYHNADYSLIAFSDNSSTWDPDLGWPVKDASGNAVIKSDQDSYCVYSDENNQRDVLGIYVAQTGYTYGLSFAKDIIFFKFEITNKGNNNLDSLYFGLYCDIDVGDVSGGVAEYADDLLGFNKEKNFIYFYDADGYSSEWAAKTGYFGVSFLKTPQINGTEAGITDMHYNLYDDDMDVDSIQFGIFSSSPSIYANSTLGPKYFHIGKNTNIHYDDISTIASTGLDLVANIGSGPYKLNIGDTLTFITAIVAGDDLSDITANLSEAQNILSYDFDIAKPPTAPIISGSSSDQRVTLYWNDESEKSLDNFTGLYDFEGYRLYRSMDEGASWEKIADYDIPNQVGLDAGLQYAYIDSTVTNGFEYWYSITAYDRGDSSIASLESSTGNTLSVSNIFGVTPTSNALGRSTVSVSGIEHYGNGTSNYPLNAIVVDNDNLAGNEYKVGFSFTSRTENGKLKTIATVTVTDSSKTKSYRYGLFFKSAKTFDLVNLTTDVTLKEDVTYKSGGTYSVDGIKIKLTDPDPAAAADYLPKADDFISVNFSVYCVKNNKDTVISPRTLLFDKLQATSDGVIFSINELSDGITPNLQDYYKFAIKKSAIDQTVVTNNLNKIKVVPNPYVVSSLYEPEYGELRKEPLRQIQFINLPTVCTIYIFSVNADLVKTLHHNSTNGTETWDLRGEGGREIAPGIYMYVVDANGTKFKSRFAVIK